MGVDEELKSFEGFERAHEWFEREYFNLASKYDGEWVAVGDGEAIIDHDKSIDRLIQRLRGKGLDPGKLLLGYVSKEPLVAIL